MKISLLCMVAIEIDDDVAVGAASAAAQPDLSGLCKLPTSVEEAVDELAGQLVAEARHGREMFRPHRNGAAA